MKLYLIILFQLILSLTFAQNSSNILKITIPDSVIHVKSELNEERKNNSKLNRLNGDKKLYIPTYIYLPDYEYSFNINVNFENLTNSTLNLYYAYNELFPSYLNKKELDSSVYLNGINYDNIDEKQKTETNKLVNWSTGLRYVILDSNNNIIVNVPYTFGLSHYELIEKMKKNLPDSKIMQDFTITENLLFFMYRCNIFIKHKLYKPLVLQNKTKYNSTFKLWVTKRQYKFQKYGHKNHLNYCDPYFFIKTSHPLYTGLSKGAYQLYIYYWVDLRPEVCSPNYLNIIYPTKEKIDYHSDILKDISKRKGVPFEGYVKSNTVKLIVE